MGAGPSALPAVGACGCLFPRPDAVAEGAELVDGEGSDGGAVPFGDGQFGGGVGAGVGVVADRERDMPRITIRSILFLLG
ncbi:hypothetical protein GPOL_c47690 [Gordonia polyisoprenivorans VH2]|uniref:Uncharacterized protein n=1 Tax=Gordonia polyisoprenivorans (strain DSM 44266 / VH2) TaxID=1112204 RepID=H6N0B0_GORPV|nr:hypothetical protein GPOL_c47690 [Gordonia polyisoprenivorans VH2]